jgi:hypothetical protein
MNMAVNECRLKESGKFENEDEDEQKTAAPGLSLPRGAELYVASRTNRHWQKVSLGCGSGGAKTQDT